jgi:hypothetical protein
LTTGQVTAVGIAARAAADGEFRLAARYWTGAVEFDFGDSNLCLAIVDGRPAAAASPAPGGQTFRLVAPAEVWAKVLAAVPPPFFNDIMPAAARGMRIEAEPETVWQYYPAVRRLVDLLREAAN